MLPALTGNTRRPAVGSDAIADDCMVMYPVPAVTFGRVKVPAYVAPAVREMVSPSSNAPAGPFLVFRRLESAGPSAGVCVLGTASTGRAKTDPRASAARD